jgi:hypothetical protein
MPSRKDYNPFISAALHFARTYLFEDVVDFLVILNAVLIGISVDNPGALPDSLNILIAVFFIIENITRVLIQGVVKWIHGEYVQKIETLLVIVSCIGAFGFPNERIMWRMSVFRLIRVYRSLGLARRSKALADLWLVLAGLGKSLRTMVWLVLGLALICTVFGITARGLVYAGPDDSDLNLSACGSDDFRKHLKCIDIDEYFGDALRSALTMLQSTTLDRWAAHVVRPLSGMRPMAAGFLFFFVIFTTYGLLSIAVGVLVWSTVELAKVHDSHRERVMLVQDRELIHDLREYYDQSLKLDDRETLDFKELQEGMMVPQVKTAYDRLELPVTDLHQLWIHLDTERAGEISTDEFEAGCLSLLEPANRFDMASLSAKLNGRAAFGDHLAHRCDDVVEDMSVLFQKLSYGFAKMREHVLSEDVNTLIPEVGLRQAGKMYVPPVVDDDPLYG